MARRARVPLALQRVIDAQQARALKPVIPLLRPATVPINAYSQLARMPLQGGYGTATVAADGTATVTLGPQGVGTVWYPQQAAVGTTTGAADASTVTFYVGPLALLTQIGSQSYAGGGDSIGLAISALYPGFFLVAKWSGGHTGDLAVFTVYGVQDVLVVPYGAAGGL